MTRSDDAIDGGDDEDTINGDGIDGSNGDDNVDSDAAFSAARATTSPSAVRVTTA
jgi:hypothetical protein